MDCHAFRQLHGDWVDAMLDPRESASVDEHLEGCSQCARFDTLARRALLVARNAPQIEVSADFSARLAARLADERRLRISGLTPSHAERPVELRSRAPQWLRAAATITVIAGSAMFLRTIAGRAGPAATPLVGMNAARLIGNTAATADPGFSESAHFSAPDNGAGQIIVVSAMRPVGGALLPLSGDPMLDGRERAGMFDVNASTVAATALLWPTAQMAAHAANRFAAMEFGDVIPVLSVIQTGR